MMTIAEAISDLLFVHETVVVPGLGAFVKKPQSAVVDLESNRFAPPSCVVEFDSSLREENDLVARYLREKDGMTADEAGKNIASFVADSFNALKNGKSIALLGLGELSYDADGNIRFKQDGSANYNSDAFGLTAFTVPFVKHHQTKEEVKAEIEEEHSMKNTPAIVEEKVVEEGEHDNQKLRWYWPVLAACVLIGVFFGLRQFGFFNKETTEPVVAENPSEQIQVQEQNVTPAMTLPETPTENSTESLLYSQDSLVEMHHDMDTIRVASPTLTRNVPVSQYRVVGGCYDREENAVWFANILYGVGFKESFYEKQGERWFVVFAPYATYDEALEALMNIRTNTSYQAWIQVPQEK